MPKLDFSNYQHNDYDKRRMLYGNSESIEFDLFHNKVEINDDKKEMVLYVDYHLEECFFWDEDKENENENSNRAIVFGEDSEPIPGTFKTFKTIQYYSAPEIEEYIQCANNKLAAKKIIIPLGEGIIDYCYEYFKFKQWKYSRMMSPLDDFIHSTLYTAAFPPFIKNETDTAANRYLRYVRGLQKEFLTLIEFCFDIDYFSDVLGKLSAAERFFTYTTMHGDLPPAFKRAERFRISLGKMSGNKMPFGMSVEELKQRLTTNVRRTEQFDEFEKKYNLEKGEANSIIKMPRFIVTEYSVKTICDMMYLEFTKMLEHEIRMKKCGRCGKYFVMKGDYSTKYCDRVDEKSGYSCQTLAAQENYKSKLKESEAWALYNKYYKRYFARSKVGTIKADEFRKWQYEATMKRDLCESGEYDVAEYAEWLYGSFPNRGKK